MKAFIESRKDDYIRDLETLVNIDSSSDNIPGVDAVAKWLRRRLEAIGFSTRLKKLGDRGVPCLQAGNRSEDRPFDILFLGHMDTVFPTGEVEKRPFATDGDRATGPGVCDMKGGLLVALHVLEALHHNDVLDQLSIGVCFNGDEEVGSGSSRPWIEAHACNSQRVFVFEPCRPGHRFVLQRKGGGGYTITARGTSAHAGVEPEKGANAAVEIAHQTIAIQRFNEHADDRTLALWRLIEAQASNLGLKIESIATGGCSDGNFASALGVPTIDGMGLVGANAHRQDEYVALDSMVPQIQLIASVCKAIAQGET